MHFSHFGTALKADIMNCLQTDHRFTSYSTSTMRLCGVRTYAAPPPLLNVPRLGSIGPPALGYYQGGIGGGPQGVVGAPSPGGWGFNGGPMGLGGFRNFRGGY